MNELGRKGVILAGGSGTRLYPSTAATCKQLLPIYDKPMVYYALSVLMLAGLTEIMVITTPEDRPRFEALLGDGSKWGISFVYAVQDEPRGVADALVVARDFLAGDPSCLILGDNILYGGSLPGILRKASARPDGATVFAYWVADPSPYGVVEFDDDRKPVAVVEKPSAPHSHWAVTGLYFFDGRAPEIAAGLRPSARGELEITDVNAAYLADGTLSVETLGRGFAWLDAGTPEAMIDAATFVRVLEARQNQKIGCPEEIALRMGFIDKAAFKALIAEMKPCPYRDYLSFLAETGVGRMRRT